MEGELEVNGVTLHYRIDGPPEGAPTVVLSNSLATDLGMWDEQIPALADRYRVLRYDKRGHGSSMPKDERISPDGKHFYVRHTEQDDCARAQPQLAGDQHSHACRAFCQMATNVATALEIDGENHIRSVTWDE